MIITISGTPGSGKSTVAKLLAKKLKYQHYSMGDLQRQLAGRRGITLLELSRMEEHDPRLDKAIDKKQQSLGKSKTDFVIDSRLGFHFIPHSFKVYLTADRQVRAQRIFHDTQRQESNPSLERTLQQLKRREGSEQQRYQQYYGLNPNNLQSYDLLIDATELNVRAVVECIFKVIKSRASKKK